MNTNPCFVVVPLTFLTNASLRHPILQTPLHHSHTLAGRSICMVATGEADGNPTGEPPSFKSQNHRGSISPKGKKTVRKVTVSSRNAEVQPIASQPSPKRVSKGTQIPSAKRLDKARPANATESNPTAANIAPPTSAYSWFRVLNIDLDVEEYLKASESGGDVVLHHIARRLRVPFDRFLVEMFGLDKEVQSFFQIAFDECVKQGRSLRSFLNDPSSESSKTTPPPGNSLPSYLKLELLRKSFDCRKKTPKFSFMLDVCLPLSLAQKVKLVEGSVQLAGHQTMDLYQLPSLSVKAVDSSATPTQKPLALHIPVSAASRPPGSKQVVIVGLGPAGLFAALTLAEMGIKVIAVERGKDVKERGKDIGKLLVRHMLDPNSNYSFGEGGAGTWSDGKLTTRIKSFEVRPVLESLVRFGAPDSILINTKPHLGTDRLVQILKNMREELLRLNVDIRFGWQAEQLLVRDKACYGVESINGEKIIGDAVILASGHSALDSYEMLARARVHMEPKPTAMGFRIEHPQTLINEIQYGKEFAKLTYKVSSLKKEDDGSHKHIAIPVADYRLTAHEVHSVVLDSDRNTKQAYSCFSFCMCPGGQIVPTSVNENELCVNGMSFASRQSKWANSGFVCSVGVDEYFGGNLGKRRSESSKDSKNPVFTTEDGLIALQFQKEIERKAAMMGGGGLVAPAQRAIDFVDRRVSPERSLPSCSYRLGVRSAALHELYNDNMYAAFVAALEKFERSMPGYLSKDALLVGPESRTSSPVKVVRDPITCMSDNVKGLFPAGEGAGAAGGIVSAAVDGVRVARGVLDLIAPEAWQQAGGVSNLGQLANSLRESYVHNSSDLY